MAGRLKVGVLISGRGSNLQALIEAAADPAYPAEIALVISDKGEAYGLERAKVAGIETAAIQSRDHSSREDFDRAVSGLLRERGCELVCLAGFMRLLSKEFVAEWRDRLINIHPSLLPLFPGLDTHRRALEAGVRLHGCTVHFVRHEVDSGPIIGQAAVPVLPHDDPDSLAARVLEAEHLLYPRCLALVARGEVRVSGETCSFEGPGAAGLLINPPL